MAFTRSHHRWHSPSLQRDMELLVFGHAGARVVAFPTSQGRFFDWEDRGLIGALAEHLTNGWLQIFCVDSVDGESWFAKDRPPQDRARRHVQYDHYLLMEVLPLTTRLNPNEFLILTGASFGAYHAANFAFRHPHLARRVLGLSGFYDIRRWTGGYSDDNVYFNNPCEFLIHEHDPARLDALRRVEIILAIGRTDSALANNEYLSQVLWNKDIWHALRIWDGFAHDWPVWQEMLRLYIGGHD
ncbi:MAG: esterase [Gammaproteobacteria bacterium RBG_16_66_13]|nr:MAG: esterase [Gammaproteobacteria bacterium RBG_16_66_13]